MKKFLFSFIICICVIVTKIPLATASICVQLFQESSQFLPRSLPAAKSKEQSYYHQFSSFTFLIQTRKDRLLKRSIQELLNELRIKSKPQGQPQVEWGSTIFFLSDGTSFITMSTSYKRTSIEFEDWLHSVRNSGHIASLPKVIGILDIHTHPDLTGATNAKNDLFSREDFEFYISVKRNFERFLDRPIFFEAILIPNTFEYRDSHLYTEFPEE